MVGSIVPVFAVMLMLSKDKWSGFHKVVVVA
jgi:hypothetical protein